MSDNISLNTNRSRQDKFSFILSKIPSSVLMLSNLNVGEREYYNSITDDMNRFYLSLQSVELPGVAIGTADVETTFAKIAHVDMKFTFEPLGVTIRMDEHYLLYRLFILWMLMIKHPERYNEYPGYTTFDLTTVNGILTVRGNVKDSHDADYDPMMSFEFFDLRPISIPSLSFNYTNAGDEMDFAIGWTYSYYMPRASNGDELNTFLRV